jgi:hypothetical protein
VAGHVGEVFAAAEHGPAPRDAAAAREVIARRCTEDRWSPELRGCFASSVTVHDTNLCEQSATPEQREALERDARAMR